MQMYLAGYVHGFNIDSKNKVFQGTDKETMWYLLVNACKKSPDMNSYDAAFIIMLDQFSRVVE